MSVVHELAQLRGARGASGPRRLTRAGRAEERAG